MRFSPPGVGWGVTGQILRQPSKPALPGRFAASLASRSRKAVRDSPGLSAEAAGFAIRDFSNEKGKNAGSNGNEGSQATGVALSAGAIPIV